MVTASTSSSSVAAAATTTTTTSSSSSSSSSSSPTIDEVVKLIQSTEKTETSIKECIAQLRRFDKASTTSPTLFEGLLQDGADPFDVLEAKEYSWALVFFYNARLLTNESDYQDVLPRFLGFCQTFDKHQLNLVPDQVSHLCKILAQLIDHAPVESVLTILEPFKLLLMRYTEPGHLTIMHSFFLQIALDTRAYYIVQDLLMIDTLDIDHSLGTVKYIDHLTYHYLGGVILSLLGHQERAIDFLEIVVSAPGPSVSLVQLDAYKKLVLIQLLANGKTSALPKYTSNAVQSAIKNHCQPYLDFASSFTSLDKTHLSNFVEKNGALFEADLNSGLVRRCLTSFRKRQILKITQTFSSVSLQELCNLLGLEDDETNRKEVLDELIQMFNESSIFGTITPSSTSLSSTTISFEPDPSPYNSTRTLELLAQQIKETQILIQRSRNRSHEIERSKEFVTKAFNLPGHSSSTIMSGHHGPSTSTTLGMLTGAEFIGEEEEDFVGSSYATGMGGDEGMGWGGEDN